MKYKAPAVHQAIEVLELLMSRGPSTLQQIAADTGFSKATLIRLLETMEAHAWINRDPQAKTYDSAVLVRFKNECSEDIERQIQASLDNLCQLTGQTIEWYQLRKDAAEITMRSEPEEGQVRILAKLGYRRRFNSELEAVSRIAMASGAVDCRDHAENGFEIYRDGVKVQIGLDEAAALIAEVDDELLTYDSEWNSNGVRRHVAGVRHPDGSLYSILAVATAYTPQADRQVESLHQQLLAARKRLEKLIQVM